ncbi:MAG: AAA family ATPase [Tateyamaria sp.]|jgi:hypothetical protein|uniref:AAA family ATPase n=1 Tax=Tateyamaria sp. TaxID=1929288 RepID=UPI0032DDD8A2
MADLQKWQEKEIAELTGFAWDLEGVIADIVVACEDRWDWLRFKELVLQNQTAEDAFRVIKKRGAEASKYNDDDIDTWRDDAINMLEKVDQITGIYTADFVNHIPNEDVFRDMVKTIVEKFGTAEAENDADGDREGYLVDQDDFAYLPRTLVKEMPEHIKDLPVLGAEFTRLESLEKLDAVRALSNRFPHCEKMLEGLCVDLERQWFLGSDVITLTPALFVGPAGVGKTAIAREIAKSLGVYVREANVGGSPDAHIFGLSAGWNTAHAGIVTEAVASSKTLNPMVILDEIDKVHASKNGDIQAELLSLLEPSEAKRYYERYLKTTVNASHVSWVLTANTLETISAPLKSRCRVYEIPVPELHQIPRIIRSLVQGYAADHGLREEFFALDLGEINALAETYEKKKSVRILSRLVHSYLHQKQMNMRMM